MIENAPVLFDGIDEQDSQPVLETNAPEITIELNKQIVLWDKKNKVLKGIEYKFMADLSEGIKPFTERNRFIASLNLKKGRRFGFAE